MRHGWLAQSCAMCLTYENVHYHHLDRRRPCYVVPLCSKAHRRLHAAMERAEKRE